MYNNVTLIIHPNYGRMYIMQHMYDQYVTIYNAYVHICVTCLCIVRNICIIYLINVYCDICIRIYVHMYMCIILYIGTYTCCIECM